MVYNTILTNGRFLCYTQNRYIFVSIYFTVLMSIIKCDIQFSFTSSLQYKSGLIPKLRFTLF